VLVEGAALLHPEPAVFEAILAGWRQQQQSRLLAAPTVDSRDKTLRRFQAFTGEYPWRWGPVDIEQWSVSLRSADGLARRSGLSERGAMFCDFACDGRYGWALECEQRLASTRARSVTTGTPPITSRTTRVTRPEALQQRRAPGFFDYADERVAAARAHGRKGGLARAGHRDVQGHLCLGLRRREAAMLDTTDFSTNPSAPELGRFGMLSCASARRCGAARPAGATSRR